MRTSKRPSKRRSKTAEHNTKRKPLVSSFGSLGNLLRKHCNCKPSNPLQHPTKLDAVPAREPVTSRWRYRCVSGGSLALGFSLLRTGQDKPDPDHARNDASPSEIGDCHSSSI